MADIDIDKAIRQQCETADNLSYAHGHHMLMLASRVLDTCAKKLESGTLPHSPTLTQSLSVVHGYLAQYDAWLRNWLNGYVSKESQMYEEATRLMREQLQKAAANGSKEGQ